ncbi:MAG: Repressor in ring oxydation complex/ phenylacetic acid degradation pathway related protein (PaaX) [Candidatus Moranbacteria bacterium GW2011_GWE1_35_17]|nr:MAG: Repressor in ring oxydation complex/ phenylacetic acid degradation pathway related protein (PaaX) [Candidatus Moranbacteria bacterium GW2011_GWE1_35_17]KKP81324.1 MAG: Repressor in ring oxydation complex/ phenylacetic acid degradation pathway related protein (PaaX) [Candidatus Moranbacteria bacterium GW2011_GWF1_35_5]
MYKFGPIQKKILLVLLGGVALGLSSSPRQYYYTFGKISSEWKKIRKDNLHRAISILAREKLVEEKVLPNGLVELTLTKKGRKEAGILTLLSGINSFKKPKKWDKKWRIVIFDIPEDDRIFRRILRQHLRALSFFKLQQSVFVSPYPCEKVIADLTCIYSANKYVKIIIAIKIDDEKKIKKHFSIFA